MTAESASVLERSPAAARHATLLVVMIAAGCAPLRLAAGPHLYDAGELLSASFVLGGSHPPGQPVHALLARAFLFLPLGPLAARAALFSSACVLLAAALAARFSRTLADELGANASRAELAAAVSALSVLLAPAVLRQALRVEVYGLALALTLCAAQALLAWARGAGAGHLALAAFVAGVAFGVHPPHALAIALAAFGFALAQPALLWRRARAWFSATSAIGAGLLGLCALAYLPLRALRGAAMWGEPLSLSGFFAYVSGAAYAQNLGSAKGALWRNVIDYGMVLLAHGGLVLALAWLAWSLSARTAGTARARALLTGAALASLLCALAACVQPLEPRNPDNAAYLAPAICLAIATASAILAALLGPTSRALPSIGFALLALQPAGLSRLRENLTPDLPVLETLSGALSEAPPPRALVVATTDFAAAALMMAQVIDGARPDATRFVAGLSTSSWHWRELARHPGLEGPPLRAQGRDAHEQYLRGAITRALGAVDVALERNAGFEFSALDGPYLLLRAVPDATRATAERETRSTTERRETRSIAERLDYALADDAASSPAGDYAAGAAIVRDYQRHRALRLFAIGAVPRALAVLEASLWPLPQSERARLEARAPSATRRLPPLVEDPDAFLTTLEDCVRTSAALLWAIGDADGARFLLAAQLARGEPRALLQLGWLELAAGDHARAQSALANFLRIAPAQHSETLALQRALAP